MDPIKFLTAQGDFPVSMAGIIAEDQTFLWKGKIQKVFARLATEHLILDDGGLFGLSKSSNL